MKIWIDVESGTWGGDVDNIYAVEVPEGKAEEVLRGIDRMTDSERIITAKAWGVQARMLGCQDNPTRDLEYDGDDRPMADSGHSESYVNNMRDAGRGHLL